MSKRPEGLGKNTLFEKYLITNILNLSNILLSKKEWSKLNDEKKRRTMLAYILNKALRQKKWESISRLQVVKICFLLDRLFKQSNVSTSSFEYSMERLGPYDRAITEELEHMVSRGEIKNHTEYYNYCIMDLPDKLTEVDSLEKEIEAAHIGKEVDDIFEKAEETRFLLKYVHELPDVKSVELGKKFPV